MWGCTMPPQSIEGRVGDFAPRMDAINQGIGAGSDRPSEVGALGCPHGSRAALCGQMSRILVQSRAHAASESRLTRVGSRRGWSTFVGVDSSEVADREAA